MAPASTTTTTSESEKRKPDASDDLAGFGGLAPAGRPGGPPETGGLGGLGTSASVRGLADAGLAGSASVGGRIDLLETFAASKSSLTRGEPGGLEDLRDSAALAEFESVCCMRLRVPPPARQAAAITHQPAKFATSVVVGIAGATVSVVSELSDSAHSSRASRKASCRSRRGTSSRSQERSALLTAGVQARSWPCLRPHAPSPRLPSPRRCSPARSWRLCLKRRACSPRAPLRAVERERPRCETSLWCLRRALECLLL